MSSHAKKKKKRSNAGGVFSAVLITFLTFFLVFSLIASLIIAYLFNSVSSSDRLYSIVLRLDDKKVASVSASKANNAYGLYVPYRQISSIADISIVGDEEKVTLICLPSGGTLTCTADSTLIYVNGSAARLSIPVMYEGGDWLLPTEIFENYIFGIDVNFDVSKRVCTISRNTKGSSVSLKMEGIEEMESPYFPESYKIYH